MARQSWTKTELNWLKRNYPSCDLDEMCKKSGRSRASLKHKAMALGVKRNIALAKQARADTLAKKYKRVPKSDPPIREYTGPSLGIVSCAQMRTAMITPPSRH